ncbi:hypothetical protein PB1_12269 [Bacillus methanolicus PB1]|uniref:Uncharacterized protein n=1 Tax=Bacillus methanolicus PB1 TaxID=997296 RepID=I3DVR3_BACMT|nr:hypothetical protein PB1_12269 [Bacillus methanolicus PB1]
MPTIPFPPIQLFVKIIEKKTMKKENIAVKKTVRSLVRSFIMSKMKRAINRSFFGLNSFTSNADKYVLPVPVAEMMAPLLLLFFLVC